jgi:hypothetical protein
MRLAVWTNFSTLATLFRRYTCPTPPPGKLGDKIGIPNVKANSRNPSSCGREATPRGLSADFSTWPAGLEQATSLLRSKVKHKLPVVKFSVASAAF